MKPTFWASIDEPSSWKGAFALRFVPIQEICLLPPNLVVQDPGVEISMPGATDWKHIPNRWTSWTLNHLNSMVNSTGKKSKLHSLFNMVHWNSQLSTGTTRQKHENDTKPEAEIPIWCLSVGHVAERCRRRQDGTKHEAPKTLIYLEIPSSKLTWQWNIYNLKMYFPLNMWIFHLSC